MLQINWQDAANILDLCIPYLIAFAVVLVLGIVASIACMKLSVPQKYLIRRESAIAVLLALVIVVNLICFGPMSTLLTLSSGEGAISNESLHDSEALVEEIADEGIVLLKNEGQCLPMTGNHNINVFGWSSTNPCYGGVGSGALSDRYPIVSLLEGLENAGLQVNQDLVDFYTAFRDERPVVSMFAQDWTLPEPTVDSYSQALLDGAKSFSDTAMVVITRVGGECADVPINISAVTYTDNSSAYSDFGPDGHYLELSQSERNLVEISWTEFQETLLTSITCSSL